MERGCFSCGMLLYSRSVKKYAAGLLTFPGLAVLPIPIRSGQWHCRQTISPAKRPARDYSSGHCSGLAPDSLLSPSCLHDRRHIWLKYKKNDDSGKWSRKIFFTSEQDWLPGAGVNIGSPLLVQIVSIPLAGIVSDRCPDIVHIPFVSDDPLKAGSEHAPIKPLNAPLW